MTAKIKIAAFGALNQASYEAFAAGLHKQPGGAAVDLVTAAPYPNAAAVSEDGRPLRGEALQDPAKKEALFKAVAGDAVAIGALAADVRCMPCMSMIGFHDGVEAALGKPIVRLADALTVYFKDVPKLGVIHMRPAKQRIAELFGDRAVTPDAAQAEALLAAEEEAKKTGSSTAVEDVMRQMTESWRDQGVPRVLFARADAPKAHMGAAGAVGGIAVDNYFDILAWYIMGRFLRDTSAV
jgi:hypothetical protein